MRREYGFTLIEVLATLVLMGILLGLSVPALRHFWLARALEGGADQVVSQLRQLQEEAISQSHPQVFGARFRPDSSQW